MLNREYVEQNTSITVSYTPKEKKTIVDWFEKNWDDYVATSFLLRQEIDFDAKVRDKESYRTFHERAAASRGFAYMPQVAVPKDAYLAYSSTLKPFDLDQGGCLENELVEECKGGACPTR